MDKMQELYHFCKGRGYSFGIECDPSGDSFPEEYRVSILNPVYGHTRYGESNDLAIAIDRAIAEVKQGWTFIVEGNEVK